MSIRLLVAVAFFFAISGAARASDGITLDIDGSFAGYGLYTSQDEGAGTSLRQFNLRKETEIAFSGEAKLENGLTVGAEIDMDIDRADTTELMDASFAYFNGGFGQFNVGEGDGAAALLQVEAPSADPYIDGMDPDINAFDVSEMGGGTNLPDTLGYFQEPTETHAKIAYISPVFSGLQVAASYTPEITDADKSSAVAADQDDDAGEFENGVEIGARYERALGDTTSFVMGAGYSHLGTEADDATVTAVGSDDRAVYNAAAAITFGPATVGGAYLLDNNGIDQDGDTTIGVVGADYALNEQTKLGLSYYDREDEASFAGTSAAELTRITGGAMYEFGPGMSFNGSISHLDVERGAEDGDGVMVALGTNINF